MKNILRMCFLSVALATLMAPLFVSDCISGPSINSKSNGSEVDSQGAPPRIIYFKAEPPRVPHGGTSLLKWKTENAKSVSISGLGAVTPANMGHISVRPERDTTYELTATNASGQSVEESTKITVMMRLR